MPHRRNVSDRTPLIPSATTLSDLLNTPLLPGSSRISDDQYFWVDAVDNVLIVAVTDADGTIIYANSKFCAISGYSQDELIGANHRILNSGTHESDFFRQMYRTIKTGHIWRGEICNRAKSGSTYWVATTIIPRTNESGEITHYVACRFDITEQKMAQQDLAYAASTDSLTGLLNRSAFQRNVEEFIAAMGPSSQNAVLAMIDIDSFKDINDIYGHHVGDELLQVLSSRVAEAITSRDLIGRFGGDEICLLLAEVHDVNDLEARLLKLQKLIKQPIDLECAPIEISVSIGLARWPQDGTEVGDLFKKADMALYSAKRMGRNRYEFYTDGLQEQITQRVRIQEEAREGVRENQFCLYYQPILNVKSGKIDAMEALLRWNHPKLGLLSPGQFWDVFDDQRLTAMLGVFVRKEVIRNAVEWKKQGVNFGRIAINATSADFAEPGFAERLCDDLQKNGLGVEALAIEVTEGMFLGRKADLVRDELKKLHELGFEIAFDDFGTGFASLTHLKELPLDRIKIDRSFIKDMENNEADRKIVTAIITLAHSLGLVVTAEGVENKQQLELLCDMGADKIQGFYVSKPVSRLEITPKYYLL